VSRFPAHGATVTVFGLPQIVSASLHNLYRTGAASFEDVITQPGFCCRKMVLPVS
jgi:hypothetical protein